MVMSGMEIKRKGYKLKLLQLFEENPDMTEEKVIGLLSGLTGLRHTRIKEYVEELKAEGKL
jgi:hypothetical protein